MPILSIDPIQNYYRVTTSLFGRIMLFFAAGWTGVFLGRLSLAINHWNDFLHPGAILQSVFGSGFNIIGELLIMVFFPVAVATVSSHVSVWLFLFSMLVTAIVFVVFVYSEEPAPAWWLGLAAFTAIIIVVGAEATLVSWLVLIVILGAIGAALWWSLLVWHPELVESVGDLFRGRSSRPTYSEIRRKAPPGAWPEPVKGWDDPESWKRAGKDD
ncbi:MAG: hypothetical protein KDM64_12505 [Verrucomicrobiae bacterium]|nr:hypothetical protein [Verrucomicrobiae bacterium]